MMRDVRRLIACFFLMLASGLVAGASGTARAQAVDHSIGDPWWDEAVAEPPENDQADRPDEGAAPVPRAGARNHAHRRDAAMNILRRELSVVRATCPSLSHGQRRAIVEAGLLGVEQLPRARAVADRVQLPQQVAPGVVLRVQVGGGAKPSDAAQSMQEAIAETIAEVASPDDAQAYHRELSARSERRRAAAVAVLVDSIDQTAMLNDEQRDTLAANLEKKWQPFWDQAAMQPGMTAARLPPGVAAVVADVLGPEEFNRWQERLRRLKGT
jgi:hypothetical protein